MKIGIFGGSFNPPHKMHKNIAAYLIEKGYVDKIIFVPTGSKYKYKNNLLPDEARLMMLELMIEDQENMTASSFELKSEVVYTCDTLKHFSKLYPNDSIYFICGTDNLTYIDKWKNGEYLLKNYKFLVIKRSTDAIEEIIKRLDNHKKNIIIADMPMEEISSTMIREYLANDDKNVINYLDREVYEYIMRNNMYHKIEVK
ncbi:MAG: nicotinate (nicotinamide) nucleotide adenylyltransferase [Bacilli bacterium]|nr:nicotinate (nicotinamide) nucleotide adenylyltransferase [Bacilli bacterium]